MLRILVVSFGLKVGRYIHGPRVHTSAKMLLENKSVPRACCCSGMRCVYPISRIIQTQMREEKESLDGEEGEGAFNPVYIGRRCCARGV